ncbi:hypothetical protein [Lacticaseibacillus hulanensis]|uniref:hypothetical protein n=1 Tax=Lacticaseibacillus hulanensis TaxID=2493111 RepID=UPI000FDB89CC|nr:hypothetical protein [Lacticaseibacillus hulanensis]
MRIADTLLTETDRQKLDLFVFLREMPTSVREYAQERDLAYASALRLFKELRADVAVIAPTAGKKELDNLTAVTINDYRRYLYASSVVTQFTLSTVTNSASSMAEFAQLHKMSISTLRRRIAPYIEELERHNIWLNSSEYRLNVAEPVIQSVLYAIFKSSGINPRTLLTPAEHAAYTRINAFYAGSQYLVHGTVIDQDREIIIAIWLLRLRTALDHLNVPIAGHAEHNLLHLHKDLSTVKSSVQAAGIIPGTSSTLSHLVHELDYLICLAPYQVQYLSDSGSKLFLRTLNATLPKLPTQLRSHFQGRSELVGKIHRLYFRVLAIATYMRIFDSEPFIDGGFVSLTNYKPSTQALTECVNTLLTPEVTADLSTNQIQLLLGYLDKHVGLILMTGWRTTVYVSDEFTPVELDTMSNWLWGLVDIKPAATVDSADAGSSILLYQHKCDYIDQLIRSTGVTPLQWIPELSAAVNAGRLTKLLRIKHQSIFSL